MAVNFYVSAKLVNILITYQYKEENLIYHRQKIVTDKIFFV